MKKCENGEDFFCTHTDSNGSRSVLDKMSLIIREEIQQVEKGEPKLKDTIKDTTFQTPGLSYKPLYKISELRKVFRESRTTIYTWIKIGILKPYKIHSTVYFLWSDIEKLLTSQTKK